MKRHAAAALLALFVAACSGSTAKPGNAVVGATNGLSITTPSAHRSRFIDVQDHEVVWIEMTSADPLGGTCGELRGNTYLFMAIPTGGHAAPGSYAGDARMYVRDDACGEARETHTSNLHVDFVVASDDEVAGSFDAVFPDGADVHGTFDATTCDPSTVVADAGPRACP